MNQSPPKPDIRRRTSHTPAPPGRLSARQELALFVLLMLVLLALIAYGLQP